MKMRKGNKRGTLAQKAALPPQQPRIPPVIEEEVMRLAANNFGCKIIARMTGISHTSVIRIWNRNGANREQLRKRAATIETHRYLATRIAKSVGQGLPHQLREDLSAVAVATLAKLADTYDASTGVPFGAYAQQRIRGACLDSIRRRHYLNGTASELTSEVSEARLDTAANPESALIASMEQGETRTRLISQLTRLPGRLAVITWLHYMENRTIEQIAAELGVGASRVSQLHTEALGLMREQMGVKTQAAGGGR